MAALVAAHAHVGMRLPVAVTLAGSARALLSPGPTHGCCRRPLRVGRFSGSAEPWLYEGANGLDSATGFVPELEYMLFNEMKVDETYVDVGTTADYLNNMYAALDNGTVDVIDMLLLISLWGDCEE